MLIAAHPAIAVQNHLGHTLVHRSKVTETKVSKPGAPADKKAEKPFYCLIPYLCLSLRVISLAFTSVPENYSAADITKNYVTGNKFMYKWLWLITRTKNIEENDALKDGKCAGVSLASIKVWQDKDSKMIEPAPTSLKTD